MITNTIADHRDPLLAIIRDSGQFDDDGLAHVAHTLDAHLTEPGTAIWLTAIDGTEPVGVAYCAPEPVTIGTWNLLMLWMKEGFEGKGFGRQLVTGVEQRLAQNGARLLIVETSQLDEFATARRFYTDAGFVLEAEIKDFFDKGDNKLVYTKPLGGDPA